MIIFENSSPGRAAHAQFPSEKAEILDIPQHFLRKNPPRWPACSELQVVRHYTRLSKNNFSIDIDKKQRPNLQIKIN
jgi:glycine dehydrogenase subunit 2